MYVIYAQSSVLKLLAILEYSKYTVFLTERPISAICFTATNFLEQMEKSIFE